MEKYKNETEENLIQAEKDLNNKKKIRKSFFDFLASFMPVSLSL
jgi:hypothetical protein